MNSLWTFGNSFSTSFNDNPFYLSGEYIEYKGYIPKIYSEIIAEKLKMNLRIYSEPGRDNYTIFESVCSVSNEISDNDVIIIEWSLFNRFRFVNEKNEWISIFPNLYPNHPPFNNPGKFPLSEKATFDRIGSNRIDHEKKYSDEVNNWMLLINKSFKNNKIIYWTPFESSLINALYFKDIESVYRETNRKISDKHYSEGGHKKLANILLDIINREKNLI